MNVLELNALRIAAGDRELLNVDAGSVAAGELLAIIGPNGAGKSTLLRALAGELGDGQAVRLHDRTLAQWPGRERARHLGVLPQASQLAFPFTAKEVVELGLIPLTLDRTEGQRGVRHAMQVTDCAQLAARPYPLLSGGERQRVQLARVLLQLSQAERPPLLLLDEPTAAQDLGQQHALLQLAQRYCRDHGYAVVAVLHDLNQVLHYADRCWLLRDGRRVMEGEPVAVLDTGTVAAHWGYAAQRVQLADGREVIV